MQLALLLYDDWFIRYAPHDMRSWIISRHAQVKEFAWIITPETDGGHSAKKKNVTPCSHNGGHKINNLEFSICYNASLQKRKDVGFTKEISNIICSLFYITLLYHYCLQYQKRITYMLLNILRILLIQYFGNIRSKTTKVNSFKWKIKMKVMITQNFAAMTLWTPLLYLLKVINIRGEAGRCSVEIWHVRTSQNLFLYF